MNILSTVKALFRVKRVGSNPKPQVSSPKAPSPGRLYMMDLSAYPTARPFHPMHMQPVRVIGHDDPVIQQKNRGRSIVRDAQGRYALASPQDLVEIALLQEGSAT